MAGVQIGIDLFHELGVLLLAAILDERPAPITQGMLLVIVDTPGSVIDVEGAACGAIIDCTPNSPHALYHGSIVILFATTVAPA